MAHKKHAFSPIHKKELQNQLIRAIEEDNERKALALLKKHSELVKFLKTNTFDNLFGDKGKLYPSSLMKALDNNLWRLSNLLITHKAKINYKDNAGRTALMIAALKAQNNLVKMLLDKGAQVNAKDSSGLTPLIYALSGDTDRKSFFSVVKLLLEAGANPNLSKSALFYAQFNWKQKSLKDKTEIIALLKKYGAKENKKYYINLDKLLVT